jgi:hypothetical protein
VRHDGVVKSRIWAIAAVVWSVFYLCIYVAIASNDDNDVAWWYVVLVGLAAACAVPVCLQGPSLRGLQLLLVALTVFVIATLLGIASIGLLLVPAIVATAIAVGRSREAAPNG